VLVEGCDLRGEDSTITCELADLEMSGGDMARCAPLRVGDGPVQGTAGIFTHRSGVMYGHADGCMQAAQPDGIACGLREAYYFCFGTTERYALLACGAPHDGATLEVEDATIGG
jgi:hypothetical protein